MKCTNRIARLRFPLFVLGLWVTYPNLVWPQSITATLPVTGAIGINKTTNKIYLAAGFPPVITVVDGMSHATLTVKAGPGFPHAVAVDEVTNKIYVALGGQCHSPGFGVPCGWVASGSVTVIDGATNSTTTVIDPNAIDPCSIAVNPLTNKIYVGNCGSGNVSVIDGVSSATTTITDRNAKSLSPVAIAINPMTNKIYVANNGGTKSSGNVTVIDGASESTITVTDPSAFGPNAIAVNTVTNRIYVANGGSCHPPATNCGNVTVIEGDTNSTTSVTDYNARYPQAIAINQTTNAIYVANANDPTLSGKGVVTVIDGAKNLTTTIVDPNGQDSIAVAVDESTNTVYVANQAFCDDVYLCGPGTNPGSISVIDGSSKTVKTLIDPKARGPVAVAVDPVTNKIYVANGISGNLTVVDGGGTASAHTLEILLAGSGSGTVTSNPVGMDCGTTCAGIYPIGTAVELVATADSGSYFSGWTGVCAGANSCDVVANADQFVTATFNSMTPAVPNVVGETQAAATTAFNGAGLVVGTVTQQPSGTVASGAVISESPAAGTSVAAGSAVDLVVSSGDPSPGGSSGGGGGSSGGGGGIDLFTLGSLLGCVFFAVRRVVVLP